ncbi:hypothetical protein DUNSADRAFT_5562 [Dunaliella salina]|uniref:Encoded protein n=1 Tax=Dunaliella salina TaxID=3046 RepID=A0ABQ7GQ02_DUNSA|nr:hypothetical protein DUNSADRAFT_5562 [Dunaliella salina]|eukprot:KAF5836687.1 hypothetical protein DUNSADRAFT_5562 [Dunaliella salina]
MLCYCWQLLQQGRGSSKGCIEQQKDELPRPGTHHSMAVLPPTTRKRAVSSGSTETSSKRSKSVGHLEGEKPQAGEGGEVTSSFSACQGGKDEREGQKSQQEQVQEKQQQQQQQQRQQQGNMQAQGWKVVPTASTPCKASSQPSQEGQQQQQSQMQPDVTPDVSSLITSAPRQVHRTHGGALFCTALHQQRQQLQPQQLQQQQLQPQQQHQAPESTTTQAEAQPNSIDDDQDLDELPRRTIPAAAQGGCVAPPEIVYSSCR